MRFADRLRSGQFAVAMEITPPQKPRREVLLRRARQIGACADAVNIIQRPDRQPSLDASIELLAAGLEPVWHLVTRGAAREPIERDLSRARAAGVTQVLVIRGDHEANEVAWGPSIREVVAMARRAIPGGLIGATLNQYARGREAVLRNLLGKLEAGAEYVQTQPVFELAALEPYVAAVRREFPAVQFVPMVAPLLSAAAVEGIQRRLGFELPQSLAARLALGAETGWEVFDETVAALANEQLAGGLAIMTTEMDPPAAVGARLVVGLRAAGIDCSP